ncbi:hypothetical protein K7P65_002681 [Enterococcus faecalis]|nr:hypothetical protein [Enterococcus faecalis]EIA6415077.1 hypothetical protein [Enterococcus faecalis]EIA6916366.1 hypothetical protein [Enterococcus faecalis]
MRLRISLSFFQTLQQNQKRRVDKSEELRAKNFKLRQQGKDPLKGWGKMINTGSGGFNSMNRDGATTNNNWSREIDNKAFFIEEQKNNRVEDKTKQKH